VARSRDDDMRRGHEYRYGGGHREECEYVQAHAVDHHGRELPVVGGLLVLLVLAQLVRDHPELLEDERQLAVRPQTRGRGHGRRRSAAAGQHRVLLLLLFDHHVLGHRRHLAPGSRVAPGGRA